MALPSSGQIGFGQIITEFKGTNNQAENEISDYYSGAGLVTSSSAPNVPTSGEIRWSDFYGASKVTAEWIGDCFQVPNAWITMDQEQMSSGFTETFSQVKFEHDQSNNHVRLQFRYGGSQTDAVSNYLDVSYQGFDNITSIEAMYSTTEQYYNGDGYSGAFGPLPTDDGYSPDVYYDIEHVDFIGFGWMAKANPNASGSTRILARDVEFSLRITDSVEGVFVIPSCNDRYIELESTTSTFGGGGGGGCFTGSSILTTFAEESNDIRLVTMEEAYSIWHTTQEDTLISETQRIASVPGNENVKNNILNFIKSSGSYTICGFNGETPFVTASHAFLTTDGWKCVDIQSGQHINPTIEITQLEVGDRLIKYNSTTNSYYEEEINSIEQELQQTNVYFLDVTGPDSGSKEGNDTYIVNEYIVHNENLNQKV